jgi:palmitoyl-[glycerolipid] 3-(E)-desaturase
MRPVGSCRAFPALLSVLIILACFRAPRVGTALAFSSQRPIETLAVAHRLRQVRPLQSAVTDDVLVAPSVQDGPVPRDSPTDFVFGLSSALERPKGRVALVVVEGDSLETTLEQQVIVYGTLLVQFVCAAVLSYSMFLSASAAAGAVSVALGITIIHVLACIGLSWLAADFGSGVLHWAVDNYGTGQTPIFGSIIAAFQGHHCAPWTITERSFANNTYKLCTPFGILPVTLFTVLATLGYMTPAMALFLVAFCFFEVLSQEFHKWSHQRPSESPSWVNAVLQKYGFTVSKQAHALHHTSPYEGNYCIVSGFHNTWLDQTGFFRRLERIIYTMNGVEPNTWKLDPALRAKTLAGEYSLPIANE